MVAPCRMSQVVITNLNDNKNMRLASIMLYDFHTAINIYSPSQVMAITGYMVFVCKCFTTM